MRGSFPSALSGARYVKEYIAATPARGVQSMLEVGEDKAKSEKSEKGHGWQFHRKR